MVRNAAAFAATGLLILTAAWLNAQPGQAPQPKEKAASQQSQGSTSHGHAPAAGASMPGMDMQDMPGMDMGSGADDHTSADAMHSMQPGHHMDGAHMHMTPPRPASPEDLARADQIAVTLRGAIEPYRDYRAAIADGYRIFLPNVPQDIYHFTNYWNGYLESFTFDPARPTSLLYEKTADGYRLVGAMYTAPKGDTLDQLNERVPLGVARWHAHTNLCMPPGKDMAHADWARFGLTGSISTAEACGAAGGRFYPQIFGWMVHVYPFEPTRDKIFAQ